MLGGGRGRPRGPRPPVNAPSPTGTVSSSDSDDGRQDSEGGEGDAYQGSNEGKESQEMNRIVEGPKGDCSQQTKKRGAPVQRGKGRARGGGKRRKH